MVSKPSHAAPLVANGHEPTLDDYETQLKRFVNVDTEIDAIHSIYNIGALSLNTRTLKEQLLWVETFDTIEELRLALHAFRLRYNASWLVQKHQHRTPDQVRALLSPPVAYAA